MIAPFENVTGRAAPMPVDNVNTDAIIPSAWLRSANADFGRALFGNWRYDENGRERPDFVLNRDRYRNAAILFAGANFGCGSSREAAAWALVAYGIRCVAAPSFSDIFYENALRNGLLPALISPQDLADAVALIERQEAESRFHVDLPGQAIVAPDGRAIRFEIAAYRRDALLRGDDEIAATLRMSEDIDRFARADLVHRPWLYAPLPAET